MISPSAVSAVISSAAGKVSRLHEQRVVARGVEGIGQAGEDAGAVVVDRRGLAVHEPVRADDIAAEDVADALVAEADAEKRRVSGRSGG